MRIGCRSSLNAMAGRSWNRQAWRLFQRDPSDACVETEAVRGANRAIAGYAYGYRQRWLHQVVGTRSRTTPFLRVRNAAVASYEEAGLTDAVVLLESAL